jgi:hypothetical protein
MKSKPRVFIEKIIDKRLAIRACERTSGRKINDLDMEKLYNAEHSPAYTQWFWIDVENVEPYIHTHFRTHEKLGCQFFVETSRKGQDRKQKPMISFSFICNAQHLINMARKRLCRKADPKVCAIMQTIEREMYGVDRDLAVNLRANCAYRMGCPEIHPCFEKS